MIISVLFHGTIKSIKHKKNMFPSLFHGIEIGGFIYTKNGFRTVPESDTPKKFFHRKKTWFLSFFDKKQNNYICRLISINTSN